MLDIKNDCTHHFGPDPFEFCLIIISQIHFLMCRFSFKTLLPTALEGTYWILDGKNPPNMRWTNKKKGSRYVPTGSNRSFLEIDKCVTGTYFVPRLTQTRRSLRTVSPRFLLSEAWRASRQAQRWDQHSFWSRAVDPKLFLQDPDPPTVGTVG